jgi:hypothetical protein
MKAQRLADTFHPMHRYSVPLINLPGGERVFLFFSSSFFAT